MKKQFREYYKKGGDEMHLAIQYDGSVEVIKAIGEKTNHCGLEVNNSGELLIFDFHKERRDGVNKRIISNGEWFVICNIIETTYTDVFFKREYSPCYPDIERYGMSAIKWDGKEDTWKRISLYIGKKTSYNIIRKNDKLTVKEFSGFCYKDWWLVIFQDKSLKFEVEGAVKDIFQYESKNLDGVKAESFRYPFFGIEDRYSQKEIQSMFRNIQKVVKGHKGKAIITSTVEDAMNADIEAHTFEMRKKAVMQFPWVPKPVYIIGHDPYESEPINDAPEGGMSSQQEWYNDRFVHLLNTITNSTHELKHIKSVLIEEYNFLLSKIRKEDI